jgi:hypothetical protein
MKVKLLTSRVLGNGQTQDFGDVIDVDGAEGRALISCGQAAAVVDPSIETATRTPAERATGPVAKARRAQTAS